MHTSTPGWLQGLSLSQSHKVYFTDTVDLHGVTNSLRVRADCKKNILDTFLDERELISIVIPFIIFVALLRTELSYILYASQKWKIVLAESELARNRYGRKAETYWILCWVLSICEWNNFKTGIIACTGRQVVGLRMGH